MSNETIIQLHAERIAAELKIQRKQAASTMQLLEEGSTVPFISRYRKEVTGNLDEVQISAIQDLKKKYEEIDQRRSFIIKTITEQDKMTPELLGKLETTWVLSALEDIYLPYKPKRKTRAVMAIEKGLEPLAKQIFLQEQDQPAALAAKYINEQVSDTEDALKGARDIIAEWINEDAGMREKLRNLFTKESTVTAKVVTGKEEEGQKYKDYFEFSENLLHCPSHRVLAVLRGETEGILYSSIHPEEADALDIIYRQFVINNSLAAQQVQLAATDAYKRLLKPSLENEMRSLAKEKADAEAIEVFAENLRQLLLAAPFGMKPVLAIDPGYRTGCKIVALDAQCNLLANDVIFPLEKNFKQEHARQLLLQWVKQYDIAAVAIGNGTAGRETEAFVKQLQFDHKVTVFMVSESGASVYSASEVARQEFPEYDVTVRGAISIGRRLMDPLAELVKIDPKSIGVGQYQHDVNQSQLKQSLDRVVISCVNRVGVNLNTASKHLLAYISGLGPALADNIIQYRKENGPFKSRKELKKVPRLGDKAFEQCAGFLRIPDAKNPLDNSAVHPESYAVVEKMASDLNAGIEALIKQPELRKQVPLKNYTSEVVGLLTLEDIMKELEKPGLDPRDELTVFEFDPNIQKIEDLVTGMILPGIVTNITAFGAFVDIGVKQDGLVHISHLSNQFITNPNDAVKLQQPVKVKVMEVDIARKRIGLSIKEASEKGSLRPNKSTVGAKTNTRSAHEVQQEPATMNDALAALKSKFGKK